MHISLYIQIYTAACQTALRGENHNVQYPVWCWSSFKSEVSFESVTHHRYILKHVMHLLLVQEIFSLNNRSQNNSSGIVQKIACYFTEILLCNPHHLSHVLQNTSEHLAARKFLLKPVTQNCLMSWKSTLQEVVFRGFSPVPWVLYRPNHAAKSPFPGLHPCTSLTRTMGCQAFPFSFSTLTHSTISTLFSLESNRPNQWRAPLPGLLLPLFFT